MGLSDYDINNLREILYQNYGDWYTAILLRALNQLLAKADEHNRSILIRAYPAECLAIYRYNGWRDLDILNIFNGNYLGNNLVEFIADQPHPIDKYQEA